MLCVRHVYKPTCWVNMIVSYKRWHTLASLVGVQKWICDHNILVYTCGVVNDQTIADHALLVRRRGLLLLIPGKQV